jgi:enoyl-CoA hydratase
MFECSGPIATIRLNRPEKRNALSSEMLRALGEILERIERTSDLRSVILTGEGKQAFSSGTDIGELAQLNEHDARQVSERGQAICTKVEKLQVPVIAAINGVAAGGGFELALACPLRIAASNAQFSLPEIKLGAIPGYGGTQRLAREIGRGRGLQMILTGETISAVQAREAGFVNRVVEPESLIPHSLALAHEIASMAPLALRAALEAVIGGADMSLDDGLKLETKLFASLFSSQDVREGTRAFLEKRKAVFKGT